MARRGGGYKDLANPLKIEVPENNKALRNAALWGVPVALNATSPIMPPLALPPNNNEFAAFLHRNRPYLFHYNQVLYFIIGTCSTLLRLDYM